MTPTPHFLPFFTEKLPPTIVFASLFVNIAQKTGFRLMFLHTGEKPL